MARNPFIETAEGVFVPTGEVVNIAGRMIVRETPIDFIVDDWRIVEATSAPVGQASKAYYPVPNRPPSTILRCRLGNERRRLHALRAESDALIGVDLELDILATQDGTSSGSITHHPASDADGPGGSAEAERLCGRLLIAQERFQFVVERLKQPGARLKLMLKLPLYKSALAHEIDSDRMRQDLYLRHGETVPITGYSLEVTFEPERPVPAAEAQEARFDPPRAVTTRPETGAGPGRTEWLLGAIAALLLILVVLELTGG